MPWVVAETVVFRGRTESSMLGSAASYNSATTVFPIVTFCQKTGSPEWHGACDSEKRSLSKSGQNVTTMISPREGEDVRAKPMVSNTAITVHPGNRREFFQTVTTIGEKIRREKGCISFRVYEETGNENSLMLVGEWDSKACWDHHKKGENFAILHGSVQVLSLRSKIGHKLLGELDD